MDLQILSDYPALAPAAKALGVVLLAVIAHFVAKGVIVRIVAVVVRRTRFTWDDVIVEQGVFHRLAYLAPALVLHASARLFPTIQGGLERAIAPFVIAIVALAFADLLDAANEIYGRQGFAAARPIKGYVQVTKLVIWIFAGVSIVAMILDESPVVLLSGLAGLTAVLLLVFRDTILSLVASIQIGTNDLIRIGDWIEMPRFGADGDVVDIALHTVKVQNWDKTIVSVPTHAVISESFKNWRGMSEAGGRRIKRALLIDQTSVRFADEALLARLAKISLLAPYLAERRAEVEADNRARAVDPASPANGRRLTNLGCFRRYVELYLRAHPALRQDMTLLVRQLAPTAEGLPLELYCFTRETRWAHHEAVAADLFDHLLAAIGEFDLAIYQRPSSADVRHAPTLAVHGREGST